MCTDGGIGFAGLADSNPDGETAAMGCDIHAFLEIESDVPGEFDSLFGVQLRLPRHPELFAALAGVRSDVPPRFAPRGIPSGLGVFGFRRCYRPIVEHGDALGHRGVDFVLPYEVGQAEVVPDSISERWGASSLGYIRNDRLEAASWVTLAELHLVIRHAGLRIEALPPAYRLLIETMGLAEKRLDRRARIVFWFDSI